MEGLSADNAHNMSVQALDTALTCQRPGNVANKGVYTIHYQNTTAIAEGRLIPAAATTQGG